MSFKIPGLEGYFGGKGGSGVHQQIINIIPPHETLIIPFLGNCAVTRHIKPAEYTFLRDLNNEVYSNWVEYFLTHPTINKVGSRFNAVIFEKENKCYVLMNECGVDELELQSGINMQQGRLYYLDPPCLHDTRKSNTRYQHEMSKEDHIRMLNACLKIAAPILISCYDNPLYKKMLKGWNKISFNSQTRSGTPARETVYFNYSKPTELHDYSYFGNNYKSREHNKLKAERLVQKFERMNPLEKNFYINALAENNVISHP